MEASSLAIWILISNLVQVAIVEGRDWHSFLLDLIPVQAHKERVFLDFVVTAHAQPHRRLHGKQFLDQILEGTLDEVLGPVQISANNFIKNLHVVWGHKGWFTDSHFVEDHAKGPKVGKGAWERIC